MELNLYPLRVFVEVARSRSLTRAAAQLGIGQPAVSAQIKSLEGKFGERLLQRPAATDLPDSQSRPPAQRARRFPLGLLGGLKEL